MPQSFGDVVVKCRLQNCTFYVSSDAPLQILIVRESNLQLKLHLNASFIAIARPVEADDLHRERGHQLHPSTRQEFRQQPRASAHYQHGIPQYTRQTLA